MLSTNMQKLSHAHQRDEIIRPDESQQTEETKRTESIHLVEWHAKFSPKPIHKASLASLDYSEGTEDSQSRFETEMDNILDFYENFNSSRS